MLTKLKEELIDINGTDVVIRELTAVQVLQWQNREYKEPLSDLDSEISFNVRKRAALIQLCCYTKDNKRVYKDSSEPLNEGLEVFSALIDATMKINGLQSELEKNS